MLENFHISKPSPRKQSAQDVRDGGNMHKAQTDCPASLQQTPYPPVTFSSAVTRPKPRITFGTAPTGAIRNMAPLGKASYLDLANGSASHRPILSPSVYTLSYTTPSELHEDEEPLLPFTHPPSPAWSETSSTSTDSSCIPETEMFEGWDALALEYDGSSGGLG
ncbi:hypothetical protein DPSP01_001709 [Paraphaeosphaeria sporulosa]